jgi:hypothetical protein
MLAEKLPHFIDPACVDGVGQVGRGIVVVQDAGASSWAQQAADVMRAMSTAFDDFIEAFSLVLALVKGSRPDDLLSTAAERQSGLADAPNVGLVWREGRFIRVIPPWPIKACDAVEETCDALAALVGRVWNRRGVRAFDNAGDLVPNRLEQGLVGNRFLLSVGADQNGNAIEHQVSQAGIAQPDVEVVLDARMEHAEQIRALQMAPVVGV